MARAGEAQQASTAIAIVVAALLALSFPVAALATTDVSAKFDDGFYDQVQKWIAEAGAGGASGTSGAPSERNVMIAVGRVSADGRNPDVVAAENKDTVVRVLGELGARDVVRAESLSFVTATVPLTRLAELAVYGSVYRIGDGEDLLRPSVGTARSTVDAEAADLRLPGGTALTGAGVNVAILDSGIASSVLDPSSMLVTQRQYCKNLDGCRAPTASDVIPKTTDTKSSHGTRVAGIIAAPGRTGESPFPAGIATGVKIFDMIVERLITEPDGVYFTSMANALDWAYTNGAHVANISYGRDGCKAGSVGSLIIDEAVDKGMVVVGAVGNGGKADQSVPAPRPDRAYGSIEGPHCSHNPIGVGGVLDRYDNGTQLATLQMYYDSSRGPTKSDIASLNGLLKPDIAAPAEGITVLKNPRDYTVDTEKGTSFAAPQVAASDRKSYTFTVTDTTKPVKVVLAWLAHPKGSISSQAPTDTTTRHLTGSQDDLPELANLNLSVRQGTSTTQNHVSSSARQSVEFAYFVPTAGTYTVTVSAAKMGERPEQAFALASTHALTPTSTSTNTAPSTSARTVTIDPSGPTAVRLTGTDRQGDTISFKATGAARGTVSASEQLTPTASRVVYVPGTSFGTGDSITVTPVQRGLGQAHGGRALGRRAAGGAVLSCGAVAPAPHGAGRRGGRGDVGDVDRLLCPREILHMPDAGRGEPCCAHAQAYTGLGNARARRVWLAHLGGRDHAQRDRDVGIRSRGHLSQVQGRPEGGSVRAGRHKGGAPQKAGGER